MTTLQRVASPRSAATTRVIFCSAAVGAGHTKAAHAVREALTSIAPEVQSEFIEALDHVPSWFTFGYRDGYLRAISYLPPLAGLMYRMTDHSPPARPSFADATEHRALKRFLALPSVQQADVIFTTHFLCARVLSRAKQRGDLRAKLAVCVTDQHPHGVWLSPHTDRLFVASDTARETALRAGFPPDSVTTSGIPIDPRFAALSKLPRAELRAALSLPLDRPIALFAGGGLGLGGIEAALRAFMSQKLEAHAIVVCGKNQALKSTLDPLTKPPSPNAPSCTVLGFTQQMPELMAVSHVYIGKPGGLSTAECCASGLPMLLLKPIPGQEEHNASLLASAGAAECHHDPRAAGQNAARLLQNETKRLRMRTAALALARADAANTIAHQLRLLINR